MSDVPAALMDLTRAGDLVMTLGAGSVTCVGDLYLERLKQGVKR